MNIPRTFSAKRCVSRAIYIARHRFSPLPVSQWAIALTLVSTLFLGAASAHASTYSGYAGLLKDKNGVCGAGDETSIPDPKDNGDHNDFDNYRNWDSAPCAKDGQVPNGLTANIPAVFAGARAVVCHRSSVTIGTLNLDGELAGVAGAQSLHLTIGSTFNFTGGTLNADLTLPANANAMKISGPGDKIYYGTMANPGTINWDGPGSLVTNGVGTINNTGTIKMNADGLFIGDGATVNNHGTIVKALGSGESGMASTNLTNYSGGTLSALSGTFNFTGGERVSGGGGVSTSLNDGTTLTSSGSGKVVISNLCKMTGTINLTGALVINIPGTTGDPYGQAISGVATLTKIGSGSVSWQSGGFSATGDGTSSCTFGPGLIVTIEGPADKTVGVLINKGTINWKNGGRLNGFGSSLLTNNGVFDFQADDLLADFARFTNNGTLKKSAGAGSSRFNPLLTNNATGILDVQSGILDIGGGLPETPTNLFNGGTTIESNGAHAGRLLVSGSTKFMGEIDTNLYGTMELGATHNQQTFAVFSGTPTFGGAGNLDWTSGNFQGAGTSATFATGLHVKIEGGGDKGGDAPLLNKAEMEWLGGPPLTASNFTNGGVFHAAVAGFAFSGTFKNNGSLDTFTGGETDFSGTVINNRTVNIGGAPTVGTFYVPTFTQTAATGLLNLDINGAADGDFDVLTVAGTATFAGRLKAFVNNYTPSVDAAFKVITFNPRSGKFASVDTIGGGTKTLSALYNLNDLTLTTQQLNLSIGDVSVVEGNAGVVNAVFNVTLSPASSQSVTVNYSTQNGTAGQPADYTSQTGTITFAPGETSKTISVPVNSDVLDEDDETFLVNLSGASGALISKAQGIGTITDDDATPSIAINDITVTEGTGGTKNAVFTVTLSARSGRTVGITCVTADGTARTPADYTASRVNLVFAPGETVLTKTFTVPIITDTTDEVNEVFYALLTLPVNVGIAKGRGIATITDDDLAPKISIDDVSIGEGNGGTRSAVFHLTLSEKSGKVVSVNFATAVGMIFPAKTDSDYVAVAPTSVSFSAGTTTALVRVLINGDVLDEENETFKLNLSSPIEASILDGQGIGTILDDDTAPSLSIDDISVSEGDVGSKNIVFTVTQSAISAKTVTVNYATTDGTAKAASDYTAINNTLTFAPGSSLTRTIVIPISGDVLAEGDETFYVFLSAATNASIGKARGIGTILNDDASG